MKTLYGVVHLAALPGAPAHRLSLDGIEERALKDARAYAKAGFDGLLVENYGDAPFMGGSVGPETTAAMTRMARALRLAHPDLALGVNVLRNDGAAALAVAQAVGAEFIRVNVLSGVVHSDQGTLSGRAARILRLRKNLDSAVRIFADVDVKHATLVSHTDPLHQAEDLVERAGADALIVSGRATGERPDTELLGRLRRRFEGFPLVIGSGLDLENAAELMGLADAAIVGSSVKISGRTDNPVDQGAAIALVEAIRAL